MGRKLSKILVHYLGISSLKISLPEIDLNKLTIIKNYAVNVRIIQL